MVQFILKYGEFDENHVYQPLAVIYPWKGGTKLSYFGQYVFLVYSGQSYITINGLILLLFIAMCLHHQAFYKMYRHLLSRLDGNDNIRNSEKVLVELIEFHLTIESWFLKSAKMYSPFVLVQVVWFSIGSSCLIFQLDMIISSLNPGIAVVVNLLCMCISYLFCFCYFGELATESYEKMYDDLSNSNWIYLPINLQKYYMLMIAEMQKPIHYDGFGLTVLNHETFRKLLPFHLYFELRSQIKQKHVEKKANTSADAESNVHFITGVEIDIMSLS